MSTVLPAGEGERLARAGRWLARLGVVLGLLLLLIGIVGVLGQFP